MAEPLFCLHPALAALLKAFPDSLSPAVSWAVLPAPFPACYSLHLSSFPPLLSAIFPVVFSCTASVPPLSFPCPPRVLARSLFAPVPVCPPSHPRVRFSCRFPYGLLFIIVFCFLIFAFYENKYICWVVKRKLIFRLLFLCLPGASRLFYPEFPERVGRNGDDAGISTKPQTSINPYLL